MSLACFLASISAPSRGIRWPLHHEDWDNDTLYSLIEVVHDIVARPRHRNRHNLLDCGWHYSNSAPNAAQVLDRSMSSRAVSMARRSVMSRRTRLT